MKDFDLWNICKKETDTQDFRPYYKEGDIWWLGYGLNIGDELDGKGERYQRPILVLKGLSRNICLTVPLTSKSYSHKYRFEITVNETTQKLILSQIKVIDCKRFLKKMGKISKNELDKVKQKIRELLL